MELLMLFYRIENCFWPNYANAACVTSLIGLAPGVSPVG